MTDLKKRVDDWIAENDDGEYFCTCSACRPGLVDKLTQFISESSAPEAQVVAPPAPDADTTRLNWLDKMNSALNRHYGTEYKWKLILSHNVTRLMVGPGGNGFVADIDLNDMNVNGFENVREAIDESMGHAAPQGTALAPQRKDEPK